MLRRDIEKSGADDQLQIEIVTEADAANPLQIEAVTVADAEELLAIYTPYVTDTAVSFEIEPPSVEEFAGRISQISAKYPYIKAVAGGQIVGYAYANTFKGRRAYDWSVETTVYVKGDAHGMGVGTALYTALERSLAGMGILNMNACIASVDREDPYLTQDSPLFHESFGFNPVGTFHNCGSKFGRWYNMVWMEKMIGDHGAAQPPVRFGEWKL